MVAVVTSLRRKIRTAGVLSLVRNCWYGWNRLGQGEKKCRSGVTTPTDPCPASGFPCVLLDAKVFFFFSLLAAELLNLVGSVTL